MACSKYQLCIIIICHIWPLQLLLNRILFFILINQKYMLIIVSKKIYRKNRNCSDSRVYCLIYVCRVPSVLPIQPDILFLKVSLPSLLMLKYLLSVQVNLVEWPIWSWGIICSMFCVPHGLHQNCLIILLLNTIYPQCMSFCAILIR